MRTYALELPEVYSACRLYVNGVQLLSLGNPDPEQYESKLQSRLVTFEGEGQVQLLLAVSDYAGIYSGLIYPPSFGTVEAVEQMRNIRLVLRTTVLVLALAAVVLSFFLGFGAERQRQVLLTLLCFCAMSYTCVPLLRMLFALPLQPWAAVEVLCLHAALLLVLLLQAGVCGLGPRIRIALALPCGAICLLWQPACCASPHWGLHATAFLPLPCWQVPPVMQQPWPGIGFTRLLSLSTAAGSPRSPARS